MAHLIGSIPSIHRLTLLVGAAAAATPLWLTGVAAAAPLAASNIPPGCPGALVVVDAAKAGGQQWSACAASDTDSGLAALKAAGIALRQRADGLVCQLDQLPVDGCDRNDPKLFWGYWVREPGAAKWQLSQVGPGQHDPRPAGLEGWVYGDGNTPPPEPGQVPTRPADAGANPDPATDPTGKWWSLAGGIAALGALVALAVARSRRGRG